MKVNTVGSLRQIAVWENFLAGLPAHAEGPEGLGRVWEHTDQARKEGNDDILKQGWRLDVVRGVEFIIPEEAEIKIGLEHPTAGRYTLVRIDRTTVHLREGVLIETDEDDVKYVVGDVHVCARVFNPIGADAREPVEGSGFAWRNYLLYLDVFPTTEEVKTELVVHGDGTPRTPNIMLGRDEDGVVGWATRSANWKPSVDGELGPGSDQCLAFYPINNEDDNG
ncbi:hypothetical protein HYV70_01155 [Candidatus Uhrbacteria bacterium]|nr:hypothetical protein [Candidatus Uhrbacteria bacterium]